jgi:hypothetical protein
MDEPLDESVRAPDAIEPIVAYRVWLVDPSGRLTSPVKDGPWPSSGWKLARCLVASHDAPFEGCTCGLYALKDQDAFSGLYWVLAYVPSAVMIRADAGTAKVQRPGMVAGKVQLAGKVIEHDHGYRAERARLAEVLPFFANRSLSESVAERYGVPLGPEQLPPRERNISEGLRRRRAAQLERLARIRRLPGSR